jgi:signal transduction histidine kinase
MICLASLRTTGAPLTVIMGYTTVFLKDAPQGERLSCDAAHIGAIHRSATRMNRLIQDLLSTVRIEAKHMVIERQLNAVAPLINEALEQMHPLASTKGIQLKSEQPDYIAPIIVDRERIMQVLANLIGNAIKFSPAGSIITIRAEQFGNDVQFSVEDTGSGIPEDQLAHVFDRFWQSPGTAKKGTGLGLFIVKGIVEAHGGRVWAESNVAAGSTFYFTLPIGPSE